MELFRVPLWDMVLVGSLNRGQWDPEADFAVDQGQGLALRRRPQEGDRPVRGPAGRDWKHPVLGYSLSYARALELEARLLEKEWSGEPGLFARMRLR